MDFEIVWQSFFTEINTNLEAVNHSCFFKAEVELLAALIDVIITDERCHS
jgi:hypothetical protein